MERRGRGLSNPPPKKKKGVKVEVNILEREQKCFKVESQWTGEVWAHPNFPSALVLKKEKKM